MTEITAETLVALVGTEVGLSDWFAVPQSRIDRFADATDDHQFIHVDPEAAATTPFGQTIAHGFLTLSLLPVLMKESGTPQFTRRKMGLNYGFDKIRFLSPVKSGKRIRGRFTLTDMIEKRPGQWQQTFACTIEIEGEEKPALLADWIVQFLV